MSKLTLVINNRSYTIACEDGQEEHLRELGVFFNQKVENLADTLGQIGDARLMLLAGLLVCDQLLEKEQDIEILHRKNKGDEDRGNVQEDAEKIIKIAQSIETIAKSLKNT